MGEMSLMVSRRPPSRNHSNDAFWMAIRFGRSRTCLRREKVFRARGAAARVLVNGEEASLRKRLVWCEKAGAWATSEVIAIDSPFPRTIPRMHPLAVKGTEASKG